MRYRTATITLVLSLFLLSTFSLSQTAKISNITFEPVSTGIEISYDLEGDRDVEYEINVSLKRESISGFNFIPKSISGDVGKGKFAGKSRKMFWDVSKDYRIDEEVSDYYFLVSASVVKGGISWLYYVGAAVLGGGTAAVLLLGKDKKEESQTTAEIPNPPVRP